MLTLAKTFSDADKEDEKCLSLLCAAAMRKWEERLCKGISKEDCREPFLCAAALTAASGLLAGKSGGAVSFTAGTVSIREADSKIAAKEMREEAERLMAPYVNAEDFCFLGVQG